MADGRLRDRHAHHVIELIGQSAALSHQHHARNRREQRACLHRNQIGPHHESTAERPVLSGQRSRLARAHQRFERDLKVLDVRGCALIEEHDIDGKLLRPPKIMRPQQQACDIDVLDVGDAQQQDRQIAGNAQAP